jgi:hypothetical protein
LPDPLISKLFGRCQQQEANKVKKTAKKIHKAKGDGKAALRRAARGNTSVKVQRGFKAIAKPARVDHGNR